MFAIEKNIYLPPARRGHLAGADYPFKKMKVGDSFLVPIHGKTQPKSIAHKRRTIAASAYKAKKNLGFVFTLRTVKDGIRVWRVS